MFALKKSFLVANQFSVITDPGTGRAHSSRNRLIQLSQAGYKPSEDKIVAEALQSCKFRIFLYSSNTGSIAVHPATFEPV